jgi:hypothetical protein
VGATLKILLKIMNTSSNEIKVHHYEFTDAKTGFRPASLSEINFMNVNSEEHAIELAEMAQEKDNIVVDIWAICMDGRNRRLLW